MYAQGLQLHVFSPRSLTRQGSLQLATVSEESAAQQEVALANLQKVLNEIDRD